MLPDILLPCSSNGKEPACSAGDPGSVPGLEDPLEKGMAVQCSVLAGESHGQRSLAGYSLWDRSWTWLSSWHTHTHTVSFCNVLSPTPAYSEGSGFGSVVHLLMLCCAYMSPPWRVPHPVSVCCFYLLFVHREFHLCEGLGSAIGNRVGFCSITIPQFIFLLVATPIVSLKTALLRVSSMGSASGGSLAPLDK